MTDLNKIDSTKEIGKVKILSSMKIKIIELKANHKVLKETKKLFSLTIISYKGSPQKKTIFYDNQQKGG